MLSSQQHSSCHFVAFVMYISGTEFEGQCFNICRDNLD